MQQTVMKMMKFKKNAIKQLMKKSNKFLKMKKI